MSPKPDKQQLKQKQETKGNTASTGKDKNQGKYTIKSTSSNHKVLYVVMAATVALTALVALLAISQRARSVSAQPQAPPVCQGGDGHECSSRQRVLQTEHLSQRVTVVGNKTYHPSFGIFPKGCKWRVVQDKNCDEVEYEFWDFQSKTWDSKMPEACSPQGHAAPGPPGFEFFRGSPRTEVQCEKAHCMYTNLYYNNGRWYALVDGPDFVANWRFSRNQEISTIHVKDARKFIDSVKWRVIPGDTILFDFIFFIHPTAIGHWWEMLGPMFSILKTANFKRPPDQFILLHLGRQHVLEWVRAMIAVTLGVGVDEELPAVLMQEETKNGWDQITQLLQGYDRDTWYVFERVAICKDLYTGGSRTFLSRKDAREFRELIYQQYGLPPPKIRKAIPRVITYQLKRANRRVVNEAELIALLKSYKCELRVVEYNSTSSLYEQLLTMRDTGIYVSVHTSNLANSPLLQPGSAVFELIHRNWNWNGLDTSFKDQTLTMGDIHHYAWRQMKLMPDLYLDPRDYAKVGNWHASYCGTEECVEAHTRVDIRVNVSELKALLDDRLPLVWSGTPVKEADLPWPAAW